MQQKNASIIRVGWMVLIVLLSGRAANSQNFVGDAGTRALRRGLATSSTNICPDEAEACLDDSTCLTCFEKPESTACVSEYLDGDLTCDAVFSGYICCEYEDEASCVGNTLLLELFECNASEAGCTLDDSCLGGALSESESESETETETEAEAEAEEAESEDATDAGRSAKRSGAAVLFSTAVTGLLAAVLHTLLL